ncbi:dihydroorotase [Frondihabitans australicus]|uniref:Dihydroorotase n=1 Tax=Frondihabitans australicus TaxID=386892 RepID=A0A495IGA8_9MICO|nr:dihydroorotase [Frondihabitans australicus]RKR74106.1 dihydroorotase [Frondihabitans australicus]
MSDTAANGAHADYLVKGAELSDGRVTDILIGSDGNGSGVVKAMGTNLTQAGATEIDAHGLLALPGLVDLHTHLREPGFEGSETVLTGSRAAAAGGFTAVNAMANSSPVADTAGVVEQVQALGDRAGYVTVRPIGAVSQGLAGTHLSEIGAMASSKARVRVFSDDGSCVADPLLMRRALEYIKGFGGVLAQHAQEPRLTVGAQMNEGELSATLGLGGWPAVAEEAIIARDVLLAHHVGARLHVCHVSTAGSVEVIRWAKSRGFDVTAEVTPHHLLLTEDLVATYDARYKVNPPLRSSDDVEALRQALADGTIDIVATDHAPHTKEAKACEWAGAANGMVGLESALSVVQATMVDTGLIGWGDVERILSAAPARIGQVEGHGQPIGVGSPAEITLYDRSVTRNFSVDDLAGKSTNSPYLNRELPGRVISTFHAGYATVLDGRVLDAAEIEQAAALGAGATR